MRNRLWFRRLCGGSWIRRCEYILPFPQEVRWERLLTDGNRYAHEHHGKTTWFGKLFS